MSNINAPVIQNPVMLDRVMGEIQQGLVDNISWLDAAFGRSQRLTKMMNGKRISKRRDGEACPITPHAPPQPR